MTGSVSWAKPPKAVLPTSMSVPGRVRLARNVAIANTATPTRASSASRDSPTFGSTNGRYRSRVKYDDPESNIESEEDIIAAIAPAMTSAANHTGVYSVSNTGRTFAPSGTDTPRPAAHVPSMNAGTNSRRTNTGQRTNERLSTRPDWATKKRWLTCGNIVTPKAMTTAVEMMYAGV